jgi:ComF family protein
MDTKLSNRKANILDHCLRLAHACFPVHCVLCGANASRDRDRLCDGCAGSLPTLPLPRCSVCALPLPSGSTCGDCLEHAPLYDSVSAPFSYAFPVDALVRAYKYRGDLSLAPMLAAQLAHEVTADVDAIIPMPLAAARLRERGFNQAHELARHIGRALGVPVLAACRKLIDTAPQAALPWTQRARNVRGAFVCDIRLVGKRVAIVDDVMTTGATLNELARNLKLAGAASVSAWVLARTLR